MKIIIRIIIKGNITKPRQALPPGEPLPLGQSEENRRAISSDPPLSEEHMAVQELGRAADDLTVWSHPTDRRPCPVNMHLGLQRASQPSGPTRTYPAFSSYRVWTKGATC